MELNELLRNARLAKGMTQEQCGDAIGVTASAYGKMENGLRRFQTEYAVKLCPLLGVPHRDAFRCLLGDAPPEDQAGTPLERVLDRTEEKDMNLHDKMIEHSAGLLHDYVDVACDVIGCPLPGNADRAHKLSWLLAKLLFDGRRQVEDPAHRLDDEIKSMESMGRPMPFDQQDAMASAALSYLPFWQGGRSASMTEIVRNMAVYGEPEELGQIVTMGEEKTAWAAYHEAFEKAGPAHDEAVAAADAAFQAETAEARAVYHAAVDGPQAAYNKAWAAEQYVIKEDREAVIAAKQATEAAMRALDAAKEAAGPAWAAVRDPARAKADKAIADADAARECSATEAMASARADYRARHGMSQVGNS